jgi:hypothetical protein
MQEMIFDRLGLSVVMNVSLGTLHFYTWYFMPLMNSKHGSHGYATPLIFWFLSIHSTVAIGQIGSIWSRSRHVVCLFFTKTQ